MWKISHTFFFFVIFRHRVPPSHLLCTWLEGGANNLPINCPSCLASPCLTFPHLGLPISGWTRWLIPWSQNKLRSYIFFFWELRSIIIYLFFFTPDLTFKNLYLNFFSEFQNTDIYHNFQELWDSLLTYTFKTCSGTYSPHTFQIFITFSHNIFPDL